MLLPYLLSTTKISLKYTDNSRIALGALFRYNYDTGRIQSVYQIPAPFPVSLLKNIKSGCISG
jgi:hypothetical protein